MLSVCLRCIHLIDSSILYLVEKAIFSSQFSRVLNGLAKRIKLERILRDLTEDSSLDASKNKSSKQNEIGRIRIDKFYKIRLQEIQ